MCHNEFARSFQVFLVTELAGQCLFVFLGQHRDRADCMDVGVETADRPGEGKVILGGCKGCCHQIHDPPGG